MAGLFIYDCPKCNNEISGSFGDDINCKKCNTTYETDFDYISEDSIESWITNEKTINIKKV